MEYEIIYDGRDVDTEGKLNEFAANGWRLAFVIPGHFRGEEEGSCCAQFIMEREKPESKEVPT